MRDLRHQSGGDGLKEECDGAESAVCETDKFAAEGQESEDESEGSEEAADEDEGEHEAR